MFGHIGKKEHFDVMQLGARVSRCMSLGLTKICINPMIFVMKMFEKLMGVGPMYQIK